MKLEKFIQSNFGLDEVQEGLHVIGTCGDCDLFMADREGSPLDWCNEEWSKDFGCIHWEKKNG